MTGVRKLHSGELIELRPGQARVTVDAGATVHASETNSVPELGNVIPFLRPRTAEVQAPEVTLPTDAARLPAPRRVAERAWLALFLALSLSLHGALLWYISREPEPLASIGVEVITAELLLGANEESTGREKGLGDAPETTRYNDADDPQQMPPQREPTRRATEQPQSVPVGPAETVPERETALERQADEPMPADNTAAPREQRQPSESKPTVAMVESPAPEMATAAPRESPPDTMDVSLLPQPEEKPVETTEPKPVEPQQPKPLDKKPEPVQAASKPVKNAARAKERRRVDAPTRENPTREASGPKQEDRLAGTARSRGSSSSDGNYRGLVSAHLARYKQYPADARARGDRGTATITFGLSGSGAVTSVRLARGSGVASIDQEVQAMVRRASPFPAPPDGRPTSFTVPVSFNLVN